MGEILHQSGKEKIKQKKEEIYGLENENKSYQKIVQEQDQEIKNLKLKIMKYNRGAENPPCNEPMLEQSYEIEGNSENRSPHQNNLFENETAKMQYKSFINDINDYYFDVLQGEENTVNYV